MKQSIPSGKMSKLTLGKGKMTKQWDMDKIELHLDTDDYSSLITARSNDVFTMVDPKPMYDSTEPRGSQQRRVNEMTLPKTYVTRSGSLFLYSDSKVIKDNQKYFPKFRNIHLDVQGQGVTIPSRANFWSSSKFHRTDPPTTPSNAKRIQIKENKLYLKNQRDKEDREKVPYSWNYAVTPVKIINPGDLTDIQTVRNLTEAALAYRRSINPEDEHYMELIRQTWGDRSAMEKLKALQASQPISKWTRDWLSQHHDLMNSPLPKSIYRLDKTPIISPRFAHVHHVLPRPGPPITRETTMYAGRNTPERGARDPPIGFPRKSMSAGPGGRQSW